MDELDKLLSGEDTVPAQPSESTESETPEQNTVEVVSAEQRLANLNKAIAEAQNKLKTLRSERKQPVEESEVPKIDFEDPTSKAWDKHIRENVNPLQAELEKSKDEVRELALREFLLDKPNLASSPEKLKELMENYSRLSKSTGVNKDVVISELESAYAATYHKELLENARKQRVDQAYTDQAYSDPGVSRGATAYSNPKQSMPRLSSEELDGLKILGITPQEYFDSLKAK